MTPSYIVKAWLNRNKRPITTQYANKCMKEDQFSMEILLYNDDFVVGLIWNGKDSNSACK